MCGVSFKYLLLLLIGFVLCVLFYFDMNNSIHYSVFVPTLQNDSNLPNISQGRSDRFIFSPIADCIGLGNQLHKIAALYAIGLYPNVNRTPGINLHSRCFESYFKEFSDTFPNVMKYFKFEVKQ